MTGLIEVRMIFNHIDADVEKWDKKFNDFFIYSGREKERKIDELTRRQATKSTFFF